MAKKKAATAEKKTEPKPTKKAAKKTEPTITETVGKPITKEFLPTKSGTQLAHAWRKKPVADGLQCSTGLACTLEAAGLRTLGELVDWYDAGHSFKDIAHLSEDAGPWLVRRLIVATQKDFAPRPEDKPPADELDDDHDAEDRPEWVDLPEWAFVRIEKQFSLSGAMTSRCAELTVETVGELYLALRDATRLFVGYGDSDVTMLTDYFVQLKGAGPEIPAAVGGGVMQRLAAFDGQATKDTKPTKGKGDKGPPAEPMIGTTSQAEGAMITISEKELKSLRRQSAAIDEMRVKQQSIDKLTREYNQKKDSALAAKKKLDEANADLVEFIRLIEDESQLKFPFADAIGQAAEAAAPAPSTGEKRPAGMTSTTVPAGIRVHDPDALPGTSQDPGVGKLKLDKKLSLLLAGAGIETISQLEAKRVLGRIVIDGASAKQNDKLDDAVAQFRAAASDGASPSDKPQTVKLKKKPSGTDVKVDGTQAGAVFTVKTWLGKSPVITTNAKRDITLARGEWETVD